jgi:hypothetical protein
MSFFAKSAWEHWLLPVILSPLCNLTPGENTMKTPGPARLDIGNMFSVSAKLIALPVAALDELS